MSFNPLTDVAVEGALSVPASGSSTTEIAAYGRALALAGELGRMSPLLDQTLDEETRADKTLTKLAAGRL